MRAVVLALGALGCWVPPALAQVELAPNVDASPVTCRDYDAMSTVERVALLSTLPIGDDIDAEDLPAAEAFARQVTSVCAGAPSRLVGDAARQAMGGD